MGAGDGALLMQVEAMGPMEGPPPVSPAAAWGAVGILMVLSLVSFIDRQIISLLVDPIKADLGLSDTQISLLQGLAFVIFYSVTALPLGWAVDRYPRRIICYLGVTFWSLCAAACGLATSFWQLFAARLGVGAGEACLSPASVSLISDLFPREKIGTAMGVYVSAISLGSGVSLILSGAIVGLFGDAARVTFPVLGSIASWQAVFLVTGLLGVVLAFLAFLITDPRPAGAGRQAREPAKSRLRPYLARNWKVVGYTFVGFSFASFIFYAVGAWTPTFLAREFGMKAEQIGIAWGLTYALSGASGAMGGGMAIDRAFRRGIEDAGLLVPAGAALLALPFFASAYMMPRPLFVLILLGPGILLIGVVSAGSLAIWQRIAPPELRGRLSASFSLVATGLGATLGPIAVATATDRVFADEAMIGRSMAMVVSLALPLLSLSLLGARAALRASGEGTA